MKKKTPCDCHCHFTPEQHTKCRCPKNEDMCKVKTCEHCRPKSPEEESQAIMAEQFGCPHGRPSSQGCPHCGGFGAGSNIAICPKCAGVMIQDVKRGMVCYECDREKDRLKKQYSPYTQNSFFKPHSPLTLTNAYRKGWNEAIEQLKLKSFCNCLCHNSEIVVSGTTHAGRPDCKTLSDKLANIAVQLKHLMDAVMGARYGTKNRSELLSRLQEIYNLLREKP